MRVALVATDDSGGGFWATYRLLEALEIAGVDVRLFVINSKTGHDRVTSLPKYYAKYWHRLHRFLDGLPTRIYPNRSRLIFSNAKVGSTSLIRNIKKFKPDILHLHWITGGAFQLNKLTEFDIPIVWSHHDMWAFTGGCHYTGKCQKYLQTCGCCPILGSMRISDLSKKNIQSKLEIYSQLENLINIGLSKWMLGELNQSSLFRKNCNVNLPNPIDTAYFDKYPKNKAKAQLGLAKNKKYILFSAMNSTTDKRKGFIELYRALQIMPKNNDIELLVLGGERNKDLSKLQFPVSYLGFVNNWETIKQIYSSVEMMITPSLQENLSNAIMECMSCGTPVVAFDVGGNSDMISHKENGYLAYEMKPESLSSGIQWVLENEPDKLGKNARSYIIEKFDYQVVSKKYITFYESLIQ